MNDNVTISTVETKAGKAIKIDTAAPPLGPGEIPNFFLPTLRPAIRRNLWTRKIVKMFVKTLRDRSKLERTTLRRILTTPPK